MGAMFIDTPPINIGGHDFVAADRALGDDSPARGANETLSPKLNSIASHGSFVADPIRRSDKAAIRNRMAAHHRLPGRKLRSTESLLFARVPADRGRIK